MALIECPNCKQSISDKAKACPHCNFELTNIPKKSLCPECRNELLPVGTKICSHCGYEIPITTKRNAATSYQSKGSGGVGKLILVMVPIICIVFAVGKGYINSSNISDNPIIKELKEFLGMDTPKVTEFPKTPTPTSTPNPTPTIKPTATPKPKKKSKYLKGMKYCKTQIDPVEIAGNYSGIYGNTYGTINIYSSFNEGNTVGNVSLYIDSEVPKYGANVYEGKLKKIAKNLYKVPNTTGDDVLLCVDYHPASWIVIEIWINEEHIEDYYMFEHFES